MSNPHCDSATLKVAPCLGLALCLVGVDLPSATPNQWQKGEGYRSAELRVPASGRTGFTLLPAATTGIDFTNHLSEAMAAENQIRLNGSGVALGDVDGDGWCDIYFCQLEGPNALYRNLGDWKFQNVTGSAGVACAEQFSTGAAFADVDGDGDLDLLVSGLGVGVRLFLNDGQGHFTEPSDSGLERKLGATSMALADIDGDGDLDLYVVNYRTTTVRSTGLQVLIVNGKRVLKPEDRDGYEFTPEGLLLEHGEPDILYLNDGKGRFTPVLWTDGAFLDEAGKPLKARPRDWGLSAQFRDINGDGVPDLYVCNDFFSPDRLWLNDGRGRFRAMSRQALRVTSLGSMAVDFADLNRDGFDDFIVVDLLSRTQRLKMTQREPNGEPPDLIDKRGGRPQAQRNTLQLNRGDGTFAEIAQLAGVEASEWSWGVVFLDVDLDGFEDLLITTGHGRNILDTDSAVRIDSLRNVPRRERLGMFPALPVPNVAFRNRGDLTFEDVSAAWGFDAVGVSHGMALADLDHDGDLDVVVNNYNAAAGIYRNETAAPRLAVRLNGAPPNTQGIGAKIQVMGGPVNQSQEFICGGRYLSSDDPLRVFAAGTATNDLRLEVTWRNGLRSSLSHVKPNHVYEIDERTARPVTPPAIRVPQPLFTDVSNLLKHTHHEAEFDDLSRQPLLPNRLDRLGPGVAWHDVDGDGRDDLLIGSGRGGTLAVFLCRADGKFDLTRLGTLNTIAVTDQTAILGFSSAPLGTSLLIGQSSYEGPGTNLLLRFDIWAGGVDSPPPLPAFESSPGPMALADVDGDGDLDLFVGGRVIPGRYPEPASSRLFRNDGGKFVLDERNTKPLTAVGLVSGAVFSDLDADGWPDLVLACEWGPLRIFRNDHGSLSPWDWPVSTLHPQLSNSSSLTGWWTGVTTGDFDGDGRMDIVASNWGRNTKYQRHREQPLRLYHADFTGRGTVDTLEAHFDRALARVVPERSLDGLGAALPWLRERYTSFHAISEAGMVDVLADHMKSAGELQASWLDTSVFLNRGTRFEVSPLPVEAQFAPAFGVCVADMDGDGREDIFLGQNFFQPQPETSRYDAGRGLWLRGDGKGGFASVPGPESGVMIYGEQRAAAVCDYDGDGRVDLVVTQNSAETRLYKNTGARPGLRVRLRGADANPGAIGAVLRLTRGNAPGPAREIHAGSGYWSQDSAGQVMSLSDGAPTQLHVRWPGGKTTTNAIAAGAKEIVVDATGQVKVIR